MPSWYPHPGVAILIQVSNPSKVLNKIKVFSINMRHVRSCWRSLHSLILKRHYSENALIPVKRPKFERIPFDIDTWHWVQTLTTTSLTPTQSEALLLITTRLLTHHLTTHLSTLPSRTTLPHTPLSSPIVPPTPTADVSTALPEVRTELVLEVNGFRAEGREEGQRVERILHEEEGKLQSVIAAFKSDVENVKVRSMYSFAMVIFSILIIAVAERANGKSKKRTEPPKEL